MLASIHVNAHAHKVASLTLLRNLCKHFVRLNRERMNIASAGEHTVCTCVHVYACRGGTMALVFSQKKGADTCLYT